jgi:hypothetical protein
MIEGEEIFESAQETGYRLCRAKEDSSAPKQDAVFSAQWDLNNPDRLFVCLQNGQLRVFDVAADTVVQTLHTGVRQRWKGREENNVPLGQDDDDPRPPG